MKCVLLLIVWLNFPCIAKSRPAVLEYSQPIASFQAEKIDSNFVRQTIAADTSLRNLAPHIADFYHSRSFNYAWFNGEQLAEPAQLFKNFLQLCVQAHNHYGSLFNNLKSEIRNYEALSDSAVRSQNRPKVELAITVNFFRFISTFYPTCISTAYQWLMPPPQNIRQAIGQFYSEKTTIYSCYKQRNQQLDLLSDKLQLFIKLNEKGWTKLQMPSKAIKPSSRNDLIPEIKRRLKFLVDSSYSDTSTLYSPQLNVMVLAFQQCEGLTEDGIIGKEVVKALNIDPEQRIRQLFINIQRLKWEQEVSPEEFILINVPEFKMHVFMHSELLWSNAVVVGKPTSSTAIFSGNLKYIVFSPYWNVPSSIVKNEIIPEVKKNISYFYKENLEMRQNGKVIKPNTVNWALYPIEPFPYTIRQLPGKTNSLGLVKFLFPNEYDIYLHDTPAKELFNASSRSFSHGCIRIAEPEKLAEHLLQNEPEWSSSKIVQTMYGGKETWVTLKTAMPISIVYRTTWVDQDGKLNFRRDIYGLDEKMAALLFAK